MPSVLARDLKFADAQETQKKMKEFCRDASLIVTRSGEMQLPDQFLYMMDLLNQQF